MNPHFWRTHDGGKTWTEIDKGIAGGAVANSIREDPRKKGLLYAATDTQVWVSFDDGDHWRSLRLDMPAISVRDIPVKDDASCLCSDLVAGTHGRGFWILDDVTPLRQAAEAAAATVHTSSSRRRRCAYVSPPTIRHRGRRKCRPGRIRRTAPSSTTTCRPLPARSNWKSSIQGRTSSRLLEQRTGAQSRSGHRSGSVQQAVPAHADRARLQPAALWPAPPEVLKTGAGMHRFSWDMHYDPLPGSGGGGAGRREWRGSAPDVPGVNSPWVAPGSYTARLTANGKSVSQPITVKMDPRVKMTPEVQQIFILTTLMEDRARNAAAAHKEARDTLGKLKARPQSAANDALIRQLEEIAPAAAPAETAVDAAVGAAGSGASGRRSRPLRRTWRTSARKWWPA